MEILKWYSFIVMSLLLIAFIVITIKTKRKDERDVGIIMISIFLPILAYIVMTIWWK